MRDIFDYPTLTSSEAGDQVKELVNYLVQFKETLEFALTNISTDNLSADLVAKLNTIGADIKTDSRVTEKVQQVVSGQMTVYDVIESEVFRATLKAIKDTIPKKYLESVEQIQASDADGGINVYAFTDASGIRKEFAVKNGRTPVVTLTINYETGNLEYTSI